MENTPVERKAKVTAKSQSHSSLRVNKPTRKRVMEILSKANNKDFGRRIRAEDVIILAIGRVTPDDIAALQETSLNHTDRFERDYRQYIAKNGTISKDEYLGKRLRGELSPSTERSSRDPIIDGKINGLEPNLVAPTGGK